MNQFFEVSMTTLAIFVPIVSIVVIGFLGFKYYKHIGNALATFFKFLWEVIVWIWNCISNNINAIKTFSQQKLFTKAAYFRYGIVVCLGISIIHGSHLFATTNSNELLNLLFASIFDITIWVLIEAMITARKRGYITVSIAILIAIIVVSGIAFTANFTFNRHYYDSSQFTGVISDPILQKNIITFFQSSPPLMLILMSVVAELYTKPSIEEEVTRKERLTKKYMRKVEKIEAKLEAKKRMEEALSKYKNISVKENSYIQPVKASILGIIKIYDNPIEQTQPLEVKNITDTLQKLSISIVHLEQNISSIKQERQLSSKTKVTEVHIENNLLEASRDTGEMTEVNLENINLVNSNRNYFEDLY